MSLSPLRVVAGVVVLARCNAVLPDRLLGLKPCAEAAVFIHAAASAPLQFAGTGLCVGRTLGGDCDGRCLVTAACNGSQIPGWTAEPNANRSAVHLRNKAGNTCIDEPWGRHHRRGRPRPRSRDPQTAGAGWTVCLPR